MMILRVKPKNAGLEEKGVTIDSVPNLAGPQLINVPSSLYEATVQESGIR